jgi:hypothetical protein
MHVFANLFSMAPYGPVMRFCVTSASAGTPGTDLMTGAAGVQCFPVDYPTTAPRSRLAIPGIFARTTKSNFYDPTRYKLS